MAIKLLSQSKAAPQLNIIVMDRDVDEPAPVEVCSQQGDTPVVDCPCASGQRSELEMTRVLGDVDGCDADCDSREHAGTQQDYARNDTDNDATEGAGEKQDCAKDEADDDLREENEEEQKEIDVCGSFDDPGEEISQVLAMDMSRSCNSGESAAGASVQKSTTPYHYALRPLRKHHFNVSVPDHLAETHVYPANNPHAPFRGSVKEVRFPGCIPGKRLRQRIQLVNKTLTTQHYQVLPITTGYFNVSVLKQSRNGVVPGMGDTLIVDFFMDDATSKPPYSDAIRVFCAGDENLSIPLHAYPKSGIVLPRRIHFRRGSVLEVQKREFKLLNKSQHTFHYTLQVINKSPCFEVASTSGLSGDISAGETVTVSVIYSPKDYITSEAELKLETNELFSEPQICKILASAAPGLPVSR